ncbi:MAG: exo-alpha-sialidase [Chloroflexota bacterium]
MAIQQAGGTFIIETGHGLIRVVGGPEGGWGVESVLANQEVRCLAAAPHNPRMVYAGTRGGGVLRSSDAGATWQPRGLAGRTVTALAASTDGPGILYAGTKPPCIFVSGDDGVTWTESAAFRRVHGRRFWFSPAERPFIAYVQAIAIAPDDPGVVLVGIEAGAVLRTADGGQTWSGHRRGALRDCHTLIYHPVHRDWAYEAGGTGAGVALSRDGGMTWSQPRQGLDRHYGWAVAADPAQPEVWYASVSPSAWKAHAAHGAQACIMRKVGGAPWERLGGGLPQPLNAMPYALLTAPAAPGQVYAALGNGDMWASNDHGDTWTKLPVTLADMHRALLLLG